VLWALKNLVYKCPLETKQTIMTDVGWSVLDAYLDDMDAGVHEQVFYLLGHFADCEDDIDMVFETLSMTCLLDTIVSTLKAHDTDVVIQAAYMLVNLSNSHMQQQVLILAHDQLLHSL
jgi:hypothetical protein